MHESNDFWTVTVESNCNVTITTCLSVSGFVVPTLFLFHIKLPNLYIMDACDIYVAAVTVSPKRSMNSSIFFKQMENFDNCVPGNSERLFFLVCGGYGRYYNKKFISREKQKRILIILLYDISTYLIQLPYMSVFNYFKTCLKAKIDKYMLENHITLYQKKDDVEISSSACNE